MHDASRRKLADAAHLDQRARDILEDVPDAAVGQLHAAWQAAVRRQDAEIDAAIEGSLSLLPRILRKRVLKILTRGRR